ncbi:Phosphoglycolate phosphatase (PGP) (PGPase) [Durusdinium trenchii]|uniref:Phosphoglycolate phosphatase (PGP) (PGPase) n=2 Tax=Durusdinium trenchii TaxID=1381693 RepID=A0ABP0IT92_9DINO
MVHLWQTTCSSQPLHGFCQKHRCPPRRVRSNGWMEQHVAAEAKSVHAKLEDLEAVLAEDRSLEVVAVLPEPDAAKERLERRLQGAGMQVDVLSQAPDPFVSIKASGVDKGSGLRRLCAHLALTPSFAVAFGDGGNDIPLLTTAGYGVAVANARETLKAVASKTSTWRNTEDAVAQELLLLAQRRLLAATRGAAVNARVDLGGLEPPDPPAKSVKQFYDFMSYRELIRRRRAEGQEGAALYEGIPESLAEYFRRRKCPNVHRFHDRTTQGLHRFCAAEQRWKLCQNDQERKRLKELIVLNFAVWRFIGGTALFASEVGFLSGWGEKEKRKIEEVVSKAFREKRIEELFTDAYKGPGTLRTELAHPKADGDSLRKVLHNQGPKAVPWSEPDITFQTLVGKFRLIDRLWQECYRVVASALPRCGQTFMQPVCDILAELPFFGAWDDGRRVPGFFAKELVQDLLDTPVFEGGRACVQDRYTYSPAGPGAIEGLRLVYGRGKVSPKEAVPLMRKILAQNHLWHFDPTELELHDVQFMLCELQKFLHRGASLRDYAGLPCLQGLPLSYHFIKERLEEALVLDLIRANAFESEKIARALASWMSFRLELPKDDLIRGGDHVILRHLKDSMCRLELNPQDQHLGPAKTHPTAFRLEIDTGHKRNGSSGRAPSPNHLRSGDSFFLRSPSGAHLGPVNHCFDAARESLRFAPARRLTVRKLSPYRENTKGDFLCFGDHLQLFSTSQTTESNAKRALSVRFEPELVQSELEIELKDVVRKVIDQDLLIDELGQLRVKDVCRVRGRLIGGGSCRSGASTSSEWKSRCAKLTGNWAIDCESLVSNPIV